MSKKVLVLAALNVSLSFGSLADAASKTPTPVQAQPQALAAGGGSATFAHSWSVYADKEKRSFLFGLATAVRLMCTDLSTRQKDAKGGAGVEQTFRDCFNAYAGMDPDAVVSAMNALYADPKNAMIPIDGAYMISLMKVRGDKVDDIIVQARKYGEGLKKEIDQQRQKGGQ